MKRTHDYEDFVNTDWYISIAFESARLLVLSGH